MRYAATVFLPNHEIWLSLTQSVKSAVDFESIFEVEKRLKK